MQDILQKQAIEQQQIMKENEKEYQHHLRITYGQKELEENQDRHKKTLARWVTNASELTLTQELGRGAFGM